MPSLAPLVRRVLRSGSPPAGVVLVYHRVADLEHDPQCLAVSPENFAAHLDALGRYGLPMPLSQLLSGAQSDSLTAGTVAVTFDDGYADNLISAAPLLVEAGVASTMFLATAPIIEGREFWWDAVERCLLEPGSLPAELRLPVGEWDLSRVTEFSAEDRARHVDWNVTQSSCPTPRHRAYVDLCARLKTVDAALRDSTLGLLSSLAGVSPAPRESHRSLRSDEVLALSSTPGITIGAHTVTHPSLASQPVEVQRSEISCSRRSLEDMTGQPVLSVAYPYGGKTDVSRATVDAARAAGMTSGCSTMSGGVTRLTDPLLVPRIVIRNWTGDEFTRRFAEWSGATVS